ncbi:MAG: DUF3299 domain-containing protein [Planctomycetia bacterium]|nr:DUF3299 domain-containing protein [Planctomycetia bacterium]
MQRFSPMLAGGVLCTVGLVGLAAVRHSGGQPGADPASGEPASVVSESVPSAVHAFMAEGADHAARINFSDLDLLKQAGLQAITPDCVENMPDAVKALNGQLVRLRGFMKPIGVATGLPEFLFVRSTDMCCFEPKGRVDHLAAVKLKAGTTADCIDLRPFDVQGRFRIEMHEADGLVSLLYHLDDAVIIQR